MYNNKKYEIIIEIQRLTSDWNIKVWRQFRKLNDYWVIRDGSRRDNGYFNEAINLSFLRWKLSKIKEFKKKYEK